VAVAVAVAVDGHGGVAGEKMEGIGAVLRELRVSWGMCGGGSFDSGSGSHGSGSFDSGSGSLTVVVTVAVDGGGRVAVRKK
jgi:hypothetical protein